MMPEAQHIQIQFKVFARYRVTLDLSEVTLDVPATVTTVGDLVAWLARTKPKWREVVSAADKLIAVNQVLTDATAPIQAGDEVAFLPPVTGG